MKEPYTKETITEILSSALSKCKTRYLKIFIASIDFAEANEALFNFPYTAIPIHFTVGIHYEFTIDTYGK